MAKSLIYSSTLIDISKATKNTNVLWAYNTLRNMLAYQNAYPQLTVSGLTIFELLDGLHRIGDVNGINNFHTFLLPSYEVIHPDPPIEHKAAEIHAALARSGQTIGVVDTFIAATAITRNLTLVNANTKHFTRIKNLGFPLTLENWREA